VRGGGAWAFISLALEKNFVFQKQKNIFSRTNDKKGPLVLSVLGTWKQTVKNKLKRGHFLFSTVLTLFRKQKKNVFENKRQKKDLLCFLFLGSFYLLFLPLPLPLLFPPLLLLSLLLELVLVLLHTSHQVNAYVYLHTHTHTHTHTYSHTYTCTYTSPHASAAD